MQPKRSQQSVFVARRLVGRFLPLVVRSLLLAARCVLILSATLGPGSARAQISRLPPTDLASPLAAPGSVVSSASGSAPSGGSSGYASTPLPGSAAPDAPLIPSWTDAFAAGAPGDRAVGFGPSPGEAGIVGEHWPPTASGDAFPAAPIELPPEHRSGFFQKAILDYSYLPRWNPRGMGQHDVETKLVFALPCPTVEWPLLLVPAYGVHALDGPRDVEMPAQLHDAYLALRWLPKLSERLELDVTVAPGVYSDFEQSSDRAIRTPGYAAATWKCHPRLHCVLGVGYFDRLTVDWLPVGGLIWMPTERTRFELLFPQPKLAWQVGALGADGLLVQDWVYLSAEFGGGAWAFRRSDGADDLVDFRDYRIYAGAERKIRGGLELRFELGYVFGREIQYLSGRPSAYPSDTVLLRTGLRY